MFNKILIANRGEIACRIIRTARRMGIATVAIYSEIDRDSLHVSLADEAYCVGGAIAKDSYLNIAAIIAAAQQSAAQAIHPGYGFLSENPEFAKACETAGITFIGPGIQAMLAMASKKLAKQLLQGSSVPLTPGYHGDEQSETRLLEEAKKIGFPVLLKAAAGGGGKGMRAVSDASSFAQALAGAKRESLASFADDSMIIEKLVAQPRHIEVQIMADNHQQVVHLFERDCSLQRRHQKIIEEAPAPNLPPEIRQKMLEAACEVARKIDYRGAGTIEFLLDGDQFYFMEMNTRLQVEHPVTEMISGQDLVEWQIKIAANYPLPCQQEALSVTGHALECRVYAEDPQQQFMPSIGQIQFLREPEGEGVRIDTGVREKSNISQYYDPMIAKLIVWGEDRNQALMRLQQALAHYAIGGVKTNIAFLQAITHNTDFISGAISTDFLSQHTISIANLDPLQAVMIACAYDYLQLQSDDPLLKDCFGWQMHTTSHWYWRYQCQEESFNCKITPHSPSQFNLECQEKNLSLQIEQQGEYIRILQNTLQMQALVQKHPQYLQVFTGGLTTVVYRHNWQHTTSTTQPGQLTAPMPATVVAILKKQGDSVKKGDALLVLEAMKMEHTIHAPNDGILSELFYSVGSQVNEGAELLLLEEA